MAKIAANGMNRVPVSADTLCQYIMTAGDDDKACDEIEDLLYKYDIDVQKAQLTSEDKPGWTALHCAVERELVSVCQLLIAQDMDPLLKAEDGIRPITLALQKQNDGLAELLITHANKSKVKRLMLRQSDGDRDPEINLYTLLEEEDAKKPNMQKTLVALLDCLQKPLDVHGRCNLTYQALEANRHGYTPSEVTEFKEGGHSALHIMVDKKLKDLLRHPVVRKLLKRKWKLYGRRQYLWSFLAYLLTALCLTFAMWSGVFSNDVLVYDEPIDYVRATTEVIMYSGACISLLVEIKQVVEMKTRYVLDDRYNIYEMISSLLLVSALPIRYTYVDEHWYLYAFGYLFWILRILKYAALYKPMALYIGIFWQLIIGVFPQFFMMFFVLDLSFGGALLLALKGDMGIELSPQTSSFEMILLTGARTVAAGESVFGDYKFTSSLILLVFFFLVIVMLLNILIAQLNNALPNANKHFDRNHTYKMAAIIDSIDCGDFHFSDAFHREFWEKVLHSKCIRPISQRRPLLHYVSTEDIEMGSQYATAPSEIDTTQRNTFREHADKNQQLEKVLKAIERIEKKIELITNLKMK